ncbi:MAG TPA: cytochrome C [Maritimibacter sp.]|nr:cytochrome C [Maritimibacter sp.]
MALAALVAAVTASAHTGVQNDDVLERMEGMSAIAKEMKTIGEMAKNEAPFDSDAVESALSTIGAEAERIPYLFTPRAMDPKSEATPAIWEDFDDFTTKADTLGAVAEALSGHVSTASDLVPLMREIGQTCRACHSQYRVSN